MSVDVTEDVARVERLSQKQKREPEPKTVGRVRDYDTVGKARYCCCRLIIPVMVRLLSDVTT